MHAAYDSKETVSNSREINLTGEEMLNRERGEDPSRAGRAVRTTAMMIKDMRIQRQLHSTQATFVQTWMKHAGDTSTERHSILLRHCALLQQLCATWDQSCCVQPAQKPAQLKPGSVCPHAHRYAPRSKFPGAS